MEVVEVLLRYSYSCYLNIPLIFLNSVTGLSLLSRNRINKDLEKVNIPITFIWYNNLLHSDNSNCSPK